MKNIFYLLLLTSVIISCNKDDNNTEPTPKVIFTPELVVELVPEDKGSTTDPKDRSINVIQGLASFEGGWFTSQTSSSKYLIINYLGSDGVSQFNIKLNVNSHAQDLSIEPKSDTEIYLYTSEGYFKDSDNERGSGMVRLHVTLPVKDGSGNRDMSKLVIVKDKSYDFNFINSTPTIGEDTMYFAVRSDNVIHILDKKEVNNDIFYNTKHFELSGEQMSNSMWFQGIAMKDSLVYCLTGDNRITTVKKLYVYDMNGNAISKSLFYYEDFGLDAKTKLEPESLTFVGDDLYLCIMTDKLDGSSGNLKFLFKLAEK